MITADDEKTIKDLEKYMSTKFPKETYDKVFKPAFDKMMIEPKWWNNY
jgi:hypothetical protein